VARKKKTKANRKKKRDVDTAGSVASPDEAEPKKSGSKKKSAQKKSANETQAEEKKPAAKKKSAAKKKKAPKKKRAPKKAAVEEVVVEPEDVAPAIEEAQTPPEREAPPESDDSVEDLDLDADLDASLPGDLQGLVAEVALLDDEIRVSEVVPEDDVDVVVLDEPEEIAEQVDDIDAVLDELEESDDVASLIALTATEPGEGGDLGEALVETLDDDLPIEVLDENESIEVLDDDPPEAAPEAPTVAAGATTTTEAPSPSADTLAAAAAPEVDATNDQDLDDAIDLGPVSTPELRDRLLAQALAHSELQDARYRVPLAGARSRGRWKGALASLLVLVAAVTMVVPPAWVRPAPPAQLDAVGHILSIRTALLLQAQQVDAYRVRFQRIPDSLEELPDRLPGVRFVKSGNRAYQLIGYGPDGNSIIYDSTSPDPDFEQLSTGFAVEVAP
jgi:hypothetical protein